MTNRLSYYLDLFPSFNGDKMHKDRNVPNCGFVGHGPEITELERELQSAGADILCIRSYWYGNTIIREWNVSWDLDPSSNGETDKIC